MRLGCNCHAAGAARLPGRCDGCMPTGQAKGSKLDPHASPWARGAEPRRLRFRGFGIGKILRFEYFKPEVLTFFVSSLVLHGTLTISCSGDE
jgi:hypothetical protein